MCKKIYIIPIFIPELACPFQCLYCNQQKISGVIQSPNVKEIIDTIELHLETMPKSAHIELAFFGGNFTGIPMREQENYLKIAQPYIKSGLIKGLRLSTRPDYINAEVLELLKKYKVDTIELGAQSFDEEVLKCSKRGHNTMDIFKAVELIKIFGIKFGLQMMIGLPGDTKEKAIKTAEKIIELNADNTRIYPTLVIKDTKLAAMFKKGEYKPLSMKEAINWCASIVEIFEKSSVKVLRVGLHPSEGLLDGSELVAGPFHQSFRELVLSEIWRRKLRMIDQISDSIRICVNPKELNYAVGYNSSNKKFLLNKFKKIAFIADSNLKGREMRITV